ncbi:MAG: RluA family pseudouridine synthase [Pseudomonadota bacterium]
MSKEHKDKPAHAELVEASFFSSDSRKLNGTIVTPARLDKALAESTDLSRARVQALIAEGAVEVNGATATSASAKVAAGASFSITIPPAAEAEAQPQNIPLDIAFEDEHLIVVNKPAGLVVHPAAGNPDGTLVNALLHHCGGSLSGIGGVARPGIVHRIDKDTSGLLVAAKSDAAHEKLAAQFAAHTVHRRYLAITGGAPRQREGTIDARIGRSDANRKKMAVLPKNSSRGKHAVTRYTVIDRFGPVGYEDAALIECRLETGRTHQVRVHCASIGHALLGDPLYGSAPKSLKPLLKGLGFARQALHAAELGFSHPMGGQFVSFSAPVPKDMQELIDELGRSNR